MQQVLCALDIAKIKGKKEERKEKITNSIFSLSL
jgi:hypothetical protein